MNCKTVRILPAILLGASISIFVAPAQAQISVSASTRPAISVLDSTKEQDGLVGSVRRVKTETARIEIKDGRPVEGPAQLVEVTTYGIKGNRIENTSYPISGSLVGKEEYKYDERGNITEMTLRDERGAILSREAYSYEFDKFGNWTKMVTSLVVFENGALKREPIEITYRTLTYYFDDQIARLVDDENATTPPAAPIAAAVPEAKTLQASDVEVLSVEHGASAGSFASLALAGQPPALVERRPEPVLVPETAERPLEISQPQRANDLYLAGRTRFESGDFKGAVESYLQSIKLEPKSAEVYLNLGHAYLKLEKDREAIKAFKESIKLNPELAETQYGLGYVSFRSGKFREAADAFKKAIGLNPRMAKAYYGLSLAYQELGNTSGVLEQYRILETLDRNLAKRLALTFPQYNFSCRLAQGCP